MTTRRDSPARTEIDVVVTRHEALREYLTEQGFMEADTPVLTHVEHVREVEGLNVVGVLPLRLACLCASVTEVALNVPPHLRGTELSLEQVREYAGPPVTYRVTAV